MGLQLVALTQVKPRVQSPPRLGRALHGHMRCWRWRTAAWSCQPSSRRARSALNRSGKRTRDSKETGVSSEVRAHDSAEALQRSVKHPSVSFNRVCGSNSL